jgi:zinc protease
MEIRTLDNGLTVIVLENHATPIVSVELDVKNGSYTEPPEYNGLSHLYEHMFFKANASIPSQERYMARIRELGAEFNGTTSSERVNYFITLHRERLREGVRFMCDAIRTPLFEQGELERERLVVQAEYDRLESMPGFHLQRATGRLLWGDEHYGRKNPIGTREVIESCTPEKLRTIQARYYVPNNTLLVLSGDVDPEEGFRLAAEVFGDWPRGADPHAEHPAPYPAPLVRSAATVVLQPVKNVSLRLLWQGPSLSLDPEATWAADLVSYVVDQPGSKLHRALVDTGLCTAVDLSYFSQSYVGPVSMHLETSAEKLYAALEAALSELERLVEPEAMTDEEIADAKTRLEVRRLFGREDPLSYSSTVGFWWATAGLQYYRGYIENLRTVDRGRMARYLRRYVQGRPLVAGVLISPEDAAAIGLDEQELLRRVETHRAGARRDRPVPEPCELGGVEVLHKLVPETEVCAVQLYFRGGVRNITAAEAGIERLLLDTARRGSHDFSRKDIERFLARTGSALRTGQARDFSRLSLYCAHAHVQEGLELLLDVAARPALEAAELELVRSRLLAEARHKLSDPQSLLGRASVEQYYGGSPYALDADGTLETLPGLTLEQLRAHHERLLVRSRLLLVAVGNVERAALAEHLQRRLGSLPEGRWELAPLPEPAGASRAQVRLIEREQPTNHVVALFSGPSVASEEYPAFFAALDYLRHRLFEEVRTKRNLAYAVSAGAGGLVQNHGRIALISADPRRCFEVIAEELERLRTTRIDEKDLSDTLSQLRTGLLMQRTRLAGQADELGRAHVTAGDWRLAELFDEQIAAVTPKDVQAVYRGGLRNFNVVLLGNPAAAPEDFFLSLG